MLKQIKILWENNTKRKKIIIASFILILMVLGGLATLFMKNPNIFIKPVLTLEPPSPIQVNDKNEFVVDVKLSSIPKNIYPAASISVGFDNNKLEFTGIKMGTMETYGDKIVDGNEFDIPMWDCDINTSNKKGQINAIYIDMTAGKFAYNEEGFEVNSKDTVLKLAFKLKDSAQKGDTYYLDIRDAVFATINGDKDNSSLSVEKSTLKTSNCSIVVQK